MENFGKENYIVNSTEIPTSQPENEKIKEYHLDGYKVLLEPRDVIDYNFGLDSDDSEFRKMTKEMLFIAANSPDLKIFSSEGKQLHIKDFDEAKTKLWSMRDNLMNEGKKDIIDSLDQNTYSRWDNIGGIINMIRDEKFVDEDIIKKWKENFAELEQRKNIEKKTGLTHKLTEDLDRLLVEIFNNI